MTGQAGAQTAQIPRSLPNTVQPGREQPTLLPPPQAPDFELTIESLRQATLADSADQFKFLLKGITIKGATAFPADHFAPRYAALVGQQVRLADVAAVAEAIEGEYRKAGYLLTRAYVPPQRVHDGIFEIVVVEGYVSSVAVVSNDPRPLLGQNLEATVKGYFDEVVTQRPLSDPVLERAMLLANDVPGRTATGLLHPAPDQPGASELVVNQNTIGFQPRASVDNRGSKYAGPVLFHLGAAISPGLFGGDWLAGSFTTTPDPKERLEGALSYALPIGSNGLIASLNASGSHAKPGDILRTVNLITSSYSFGPHLRYPLLRSRARSLYIDGGFSVRAADVAALGQNFSHDDWRTVDLGLTFVDSGWLNGATAIAVTMTQGLQVFSASRNGSPELSRPGAATDFTKIALTAQRIQRIDGPVSLFVNIQAQYAFAPLVAGEQIAFGGDTIGRGYDPASILGDHGIGGTVELRYDHSFDGKWLRTIQPYVFSDTAAVWNRRHNLAGNDRLASIGGGVRLGLAHRIRAGVELAHDLRSVADNDNGRRDTRVLFDIGIGL